MIRPGIRTRMLLCLSLALAAAGPACVSRNVESIDSEEAASMPPPPAPVDPAGRPAVETEVPGIDGTVSAAEGVAVPPGVLYVIVRVSGREGGPPLAVKQLSAELPATFRVTEADSMVPGTPLVGDLDVIARLDQDGNAFSTQPGDLEGRDGPVQAGGTVEIVLTPASAEDGGPSGR